MQRLAVTFAILFAALLAAPDIPDAAACPMCKTANESEDRRPQAYMYSILFMLAMPATVLTGFGVGFYRLARKQQAGHDAIVPSDERSE